MKQFFEYAGIFYQICCQNSELDDQNDDLSSPQNILGTFYVPVFKVWEAVTLT